jgi:uncharacterized RDD family membrane protein YckC
VTRAVITCPAVFDEVEKDKLREAARQAGFVDVALLDEPVAAADAYTRNGIKVGRHVLVYDLGGGTFDLAWLAREEGEDEFRLAMEPRGKRIGGEDFDRAIYDHFEAEVCKESEQPICSDELDVDLLHRCRKLKESLSASEQSAPVAWPGHGKRLTLRLSRACFESLVENHVELTVRLTRSIQEDAEAAGYPLESVILIGGASRTPCIIRRLHETLHVQPRRWEKQDVAVALGAAYHAHRLWGEPDRRHREIDEAPRQQKLQEEARLQAEKERRQREIEEEARKQKLQQEETDREKQGKADATPKQPVPTDLVSKKYRKRAVIEVVRWGGRVGVIFIFIKLLIAIRYPYARLVPYATLICVALGTVACRILDACLRRFESVIPEKHLDARLGEVFAKIARGWRNDLTDEEARVVEEGRRRDGIETIDEAPRRTPGESGAGGPPLASRRSRLVAVVIDVLAVFLVLLPGWLLVISGNNPKDIPAGPLVMMAGELILVCVQICLLTTRGQSIGKMVVGVRIIKQDGRSPGFVGAVLFRSIVPSLIGGVSYLGIPYLGLAIAVIDILFIFGGKRRCLHDRIAGTIVVADSAREQGYPAEEGKREERDSEEAERAPASGSAPGDWLTDGPAPAANPISYNKDLERKFNTAVSKIKKGDLRGGFKIINKLIETRPGFIKPWEFCGDWYRRKEEYPDALFHYEEAIKLGTRNPHTYIRAAISASHIGDIERAYTILKQSVSELPHCDLPGLLWFNLACYATRLQNNDEAMYYLKNASLNGFIDTDKYRTDADLIPLRQREDFTSLLRVLDAPSEAPLE